VKAIYFKRRTEGLTDSPMFSTSTQNIQNLTAGGKQWDSNGSNGMRDANGLRSEKHRWHDG
jgi:hypothetical protein